MIDSQLLATARAEFSALDFTAENDRIAALEAERVRIDGAIASAENAPANSPPKSAQSSGPTPARPSPTRCSTMSRRPMLPRRRPVATP